MKFIYLFDVTEAECHYSCETVRENTSGWLDKQLCMEKKGENGTGGEKSSSTWFKYKENEKSLRI